MKKMLSINIVLYLIFIFLLDAISMTGIFYASLILSTFLSAALCFRFWKLNFQKINIYFYSGNMAIVAGIVFFALTNLNALSAYGVIGYFLKIRTLLGIHLYEFIFTYFINFIFFYFVILISFFLIRNFSHAISRKGE